MANKLVKATLGEVTWSTNKWVPVPKPPAFEVQFNPQSLKVNYANQKAGGEQNKGSPVQFVGKGTTKLSLELVFDITILEIDDAANVEKDVRRFTDKVKYFMKPVKKGTRGSGAKQEDVFLPPAVEFIWGQFTFDGVMDSVDETLDFWSEDGYPLRATLSVSISQQEIIVPPSDATITPFQSPTGANEFVTPPKGKGLADVAGKNYRAIAAANGIENPRILPIGVMLDLSGSASFGAGARASLGLEATASVSLGASVGAGATVSAGATATAGAGVEAEAGFR